MISDLVTNHLVGKTRSEIAQLLGALRLGDIGYFEPPQQGWHIAYDIGIEQTSLWDQGVFTFDPGHEELLIKFAADGRFKAWTIIGSRHWKHMVQELGLIGYELPPERENMTRSILR